MRLPDDADGNASTGNYELRQEMERQLAAERMITDELAAEIEQLQQVIIDICADQGLQPPVFLDSKLARYWKAKNNEMRSM